MQVRQPLSICARKTALVPSRHCGEQILESQIQKADTEASAVWKGSGFERFANAL